MRGGLDTAEVYMWVMSQSTGPWQVAHFSAADEVQLLTVLSALLLSLSYAGLQPGFIWGLDINVCSHLLYYLSFPYLKLMNLLHSGLLLGHLNLYIVKNKAKSLVYHSAYQSSVLMDRFLPSL